MNPFITIEEIHEKAQEVFMIYCSSHLSPPEEYYSGSHWLVVDDMTAKFVNNVCSLEIPGDKILACYDSGDLFSASKAYWALRAAGFAEVRIMPRSVYSANLIQLISGTPPLISKAERAYLPFNNELVMTKEEFLKRETFYQQAVQINYLAFNILDSNGRLQTAESVLSFLQTSGIKFSQSRASIVHGKRACLGGIMLAYVSKRSVSVVIDEIESLGTPQVRDSRTRETKLNQTENSDEVKYNTVMAGYSISVDDPAKRTVKKSVHTRDGGQCKNCIIT